MSNFQLNKDTFTGVGQRVAEHQATNKEHKADNERISDEKMTNYCELAAEILGVRLRNGNLPTQIGKQFRTAMMEQAGLDPSKGVGQRYYNGAVGIVRFAKDWDIPTQGTSSAIKDALYVQNITTESELHKRIKGDEEETDAEKAAKQWVGSVTYRKVKEGEDVDITDPVTGETRKAEPGERVANGFRESERNVDDLYAAIARAEAMRNAYREASDEIQNKEKSFHEIIAALEAAA